MLTSTKRLDLIKKFRFEHKNVINDIAHLLHKSYIEQRGSLAWLFQQPDKYRFLSFNQKNKYINLISVVDLLHMHCLPIIKTSTYIHNGSFIKNNSGINNNSENMNISISTWNAICIELIKRGEIELAVYTLAVKKFLSHKNIILAYYTEMISDSKSIDFNPQVLLIDIDYIKKELEVTDKSLWRLIKDNDILISKYENNNMEQLNFWKNGYTKAEYINDYEDKISTVNNNIYPQIYYKFIYVDKYTKNNMINQNLFIHI